MNVEIPMKAQPIIPAEQPKTENNPVMKIGNAKSVLKKIISDSFNVSLFSAIKDGK